MLSYNQDYYILIDDFSRPIRMRYYMGPYGTSRMHELVKGPVNKPIIFSFDEDRWTKGFKPEDVILNVSGLIINDNMKQEFFNLLGQDDLFLYQAYFVAPDGKIFEGYWFIPTPEKPKEWLDIENSDISYEDDDPKKEIYYIRKYSLDNYVLNNIDEKQRQFFQMSYSDFGSSDHIVHKNVMNYLRTYSKRNFKFVPLSEFTRRIGNQGPVPEFAI